MKKKNVFVILGLIAILCVVLGAVLIKKLNIQTAKEKIAETSTLDKTSLSENDNKNELVIETTTNREENKVIEDIKEETIVEENIKENSLPVEEEINNSNESEPILPKDNSSSASNNDLNIPPVPQEEKTIEQQPIIEEQPIQQNEVQEETTITQPTQQEPVYCVDGGSIHILGDGENDHRLL